MDILTVWSAYKAAAFYKEMARSNRMNDMGIAVEKDRHALVWQRYDRLARKCENRINAFLKNNSEATKICWVCGYWEAACPHDFVWDNAT